MTQLDIEMLIMGVLRDAKVLGCADRNQLIRYAAELEEIQDEIARATEKARRMQVAA